MTMDLWNFEASAPAFFVHHVAIVGMCACLAHYAMKWIQERKRRTARPQVDSHMVSAKAGP
ncbi:hypothetical protein BQ8482_380139 [Mesorhizobium delmotii]|uniref:Uncharacterized protein n=1 Tax=Mesorhizobium delmotii TaxID=1631247 RepID=A0A2P9AS23_9HYPH|nr:hypothetical protein BQ8482_380139 [Mesorhizobium delmotii]